MNKYKKCTINTNRWTNYLQHCIKKNSLFFIIWAVFFSASVYAQAESTPTVTAPSTEVLAEMLANEQTRNQLIEQLRAASTDANAEAADLVDNTTTVPLVVSTDVAESNTDRLALQLHSFSHELRTDMLHAQQTVWALLKGEATYIERIKAWQSASLSLFITLVVAGVALGLFRVLLRPVVSVVVRWATQLPTKHKQASEQKQENYVRRYIKLHKLVGATGVFLLEIVAIALAALIAYSVTITVFAHEHHATLFSMQFLAAFFIVESVKAFGSVLFAKEVERLRFIPTEDQGARYWQGWFTMIVSVGGYGLLVVVPFLQSVFAPSVANVFGSLLMLAVYLYAMGVLWRQRQAITQGFIQLATTSTDAVAGSLWRIVARLWLVAAWVYFTVLLFMTLVEHEHALSFMAQASLQSFISILVGGVLFILIHSLAAHHIQLSTSWNAYFPLLEQRLNAYLPMVYRVLRLFLLIAILFSLLDAWHVLDFNAWVHQGQGVIVLQTVLRIVVVLAVALCAWVVLASFIEHRLAVSGVHMPSGRERTLLMMFKNALIVIISILTLLIVLSQLGIDIGPLIAGAGVVGLAVGFGAQKLVQDVITGVFIQLENGMNQGDVVEVAGLNGTVEKLTIRSVGIRTLDGGYHLVPFSSINSVSNYTRDYGYTVGEYTVAHRESVDEVMQYLDQAFTDLKQDASLNEALIEDIVIQGVTAINQEGVKLRVLIKTQPGMQWKIQREYNRYVKLCFDRAGIEIPYPQTVLHFGRDKDGQASPVDVRRVDGLLGSSA